MDTMEQTASTADERVAEYRAWKIAHPFKLTDAETEAVRWYLRRLESEWADALIDPRNASDESENREGLNDVRGLLALLDSDPVRFVDEESDLIGDAYDDLEQAWRSDADGDLPDLERFIVYLGLVRRLELRACGVEA